MISSWRRRRSNRRTAKQRLWGEKNSATELTVPDHFRCPISLDLMKDPVTLSTGITYDRSSIETWIESGNLSCPITNQTLQSLEPIPNHNIRKMIQDWCVDNKSYGIERIPTPRVPLSSIELLTIETKITNSSKRGDSTECKNWVEKIKRLGKETERNKKCIIANGTAKVLSSAFEDFSKLAEHNFERNVDVLAEILSTLTIIFPLHEESTKHLESSSSIQTLVWFLKVGDLSGRRNSVLVLKEIISLYPEKVTGQLAAIDGALEGLVKLIREPICSISKKASLFIIYHTMTSSSSSRSITKPLLEMGLVSLLLETLVDSERSMCERALGVFDELCETKEGREMAYDHALTMPVIVKKILRVSDLATELSVSIVWKLMKNENEMIIKREDGRGVNIEALQVGAFQKVLLLLQVGCSEWTKEKATEVLKMMNNLHRDTFECIDSLDFKDLKRPF